MPKLEPLNIKCTSTSCEDGLHCFMAVKATPGLPQHGPCRDCGEELDDWPRLHSRNLQDVDHTFDALRRELIRHHFWHVEINVRAVNYARRKGKVKLAETVRSQLAKSVGPANPFRDGRQTPRENSPNPIHFAQHATASCCRRCIEEWHGISRGRELTDVELDYLSALAMRFLLERLPDLTLDGEDVPPVRDD